VTNVAAAREVVAAVIRRSIEISEAGAIGARYRDLFDAAARSMRRRLSGDVSWRL